LELEDAFASSAIDFSTQDRHRAFPSPLDNWFLLKDDKDGRDCLHDAQIVFVFPPSLPDDKDVAVVAAAAFAADAFRSACSTAATHCLHLSGPPVLRYRSSAFCNGFYMKRNVYESKRGFFGGHQQQRLLI